MNIAGNFQTEDEEIRVVKAYLKRNKIEYEKVWKHHDANAGDVMVLFPNKLYSLFEVKQESYKRFSKYGEYGIDFLSAFLFKAGVNEKAWQTINKPQKINDFLNAIETDTKTLKLGKLAYSYSDVWLFYVKDESGEYTHLECYDGRKVETKEFFDYLKKHCCFAVNKKTSKELSHNDKFHSATFFIKPEKLKNMRITKDNLYHNSHMNLF